MRPLPPPEPTPTDRLLQDAVLVIPARQLAAFVLELCRHAAHLGSDDDQE